MGSCLAVNFALFPLRNIAVLFANLERTLQYNYTCKYRQHTERMRKNCYCNFAYSTTDMAEYSAKRYNDRDDICYHGIAPFSNRVKFTHDCSNFTSGVPSASELSMAFLRKVYLFFTVILYRKTYVSARQMTD